MRTRTPVIFKTGIRSHWIALFLLFFSATAHSAPDGLAPGPDVIVGDLWSLQQFGSNGTQVGLAMGTDTCNAGNALVNFFPLPMIDHPVLIQNLYRMSGGPNNTNRFEQIGQSWGTHAFATLQANACGFGCAPGPDGSHLGAGCSTPDTGSINAGPLNLGSRAWVNPFTGVFPISPNPANHAGHTHTGTSHRILVGQSDLDTTTNGGATYFAEAQLVTPIEQSWCQGHPSECNQFNNVSFRQFSVTGTTNFVFSPVGATTRMMPAINAWTGATIQTIEPAPGLDGRAFLAYKVTKVATDYYHYEYAIYNQNLDRAIQSFMVPLPSPAPILMGLEAINGILNPGFHAPPQHPGFTNDGTQGDAGYSNASWTINNNSLGVTWSSETFAQNPNANAIRWGTLYNFRFDAERPPQAGNATVRFFKTGSPVTVPIEFPSGGGGPPTPPPPTPSVTPGANHFEVTAPPKVIAFNGFNFTVRALDQFNNTVTNYAGTVHFTTTAASALLPPDSTLTNGFREFSADIESTGIQTITATDAVTPSITGTSNNIMVLSDQPTPPPTPSPTASPICTPLPPATQGFDNITNLVPAGWFIQNNSQPGPGITGWFQGNTAVFPAQSGAGSSYIGANFNNGTATSTLSNWLLTPPIIFGNGAGIIFWTRTVDTPAFPDRLQVRMSTNGASTNVGSTATDVGDFTTLLLDINPTYSTTGYPNEWTQFTVLVSGVTTPVSGRLAFRYFVENGGPGGNNSDYIGIDSVSIGPGCGGSFPPPPPTPTPSPSPTASPSPVPKLAAQFSISAPVKWDINVPLQFGVQARDKFGNPTTEYSGTMHFTCTDPAAELPPDSTMQNGTGTFTATLHTLGNWTITATDTVNTFITGTSDPIIVIGTTPTPSPTATAITQPRNVSTRLNVQTGDNAGIGGFIVTGTNARHLLFRGIGPSLVTAGVPNALANPTLDLRDANGVQLLSNDDWRDAQETEIAATGIAPTNDLEAAIITTLDPGSYTIILRGRDATSGVGLVEIYDISSSTESKLANLSTRAMVNTGNDLVIAGFILDGGTNDRVILRGVGPSLTDLGLTDALPDPTLELRDSNGTLLMSNNDWQDDPTGTQPGLITAAGLGLINNLESGIAATLSPGMYTALLTGRNGGIGVGLVEIYDLGP